MGDSSKYQTRQAKISPVRTEDWVLGINDLRNDQTCSYMLINVGSGEYKICKSQEGKELVIAGEFLRENQTES